MNVRNVWYTNYRMARLIRGFERCLLSGNASSLAVPHFDEWMATFQNHDCLQYARRNGKFGTNGTLKRFVIGPNRRLPT